MAMEPGDFGPGVIFIEDEFSTLTDEGYDAALNAWLEGLEAADAIVVPVSAADTLRGLRDHGEGWSDRVVADVNRGWVLPSGRPGLGDGQCRQSALVPFYTGCFERHTTIPCSYTMSVEQAGMFVKVVTTVVSAGVRQCPLVSAGDLSATT